MDKYINTPVGSFRVPRNIQDSIDKLSDIELLEKYTTECRDFIDPFLFGEVQRRRLVPLGRFMKDFEMKLEELKCEEVRKIPFMERTGEEQMMLYNHWFKTPLSQRKEAVWKYLGMSKAKYNSWCEGDLKLGDESFKEVDDRWVAFISKDACLHKENFAEIFKSKGIVLTKRNFEKVWACLDLSSSTGGSLMERVETAIGFAGLVEKLPLKKLPLDEQINNSEKFQRRQLLDQPEGMGDLSPMQEKRKMKNEER